MRPVTALEPEGKLEVEPSTDSVADLAKPTNPRHRRTVSIEDAILRSQEMLKVLWKNCGQFLPCEQFEPAAKLGEPSSMGQQPEVQRAFPDIKVTLSGATKTEQIVGLQLTDQRWEVP